MLVEDGKIERKETLKDTYDKYLHPNVLDHETKEMWDMLGNNEILSLFQFDTETGSVSAQRIKPDNVVTMAQANSVMRLMSDENSGEQPIDVFVRHRNDISLWYDEMEEWNLNTQEIEVMEKHLLKYFGVATTQEDIMLISMDEDITGFSVAESNKLRKAVAKKKKEDIDAVTELFYKKGIEIGTRIEFLDYVWKVQISRLLGYAFSVLHSTAYSLIGLQEMNLVYHYPRVYWNTAVLTVDAGANENNDNNKGTNYGKIASAISNMQDNGVDVALPDINQANFGFKADSKNDRIIFGLKGINGMSDETVREIIDKRPYSNLQSFLNKNFFIQDSIIKQSHLIQLIKGGCFDETEPNRSREDILRDFVRLISEPKSKLNMQNFSMLINHNLIPQKFALEVRFFKYRAYIFGKDRVPIEIIYGENKKGERVVVDKHYLLDDISTNFYLEHFNEDNVVSYSGTNLIISQGEFKKEYDKKMEEVKNFVTGNKELLKQLNDSLFNQAWSKYGEGTVSQWEMESLSYYHGDHELKNVNREKYRIVNFKELSEEPKIVEWTKYRGRNIPKFRIDRIVGTVLDRDKMKHTIDLLTPDGVVTVKMYAGAFVHYDKQISVLNPTGATKKTVLEKSWFTRGNKIAVVGYRSGKYFRPRTYKDSIYQHTISLIKEIDERGNLKFQLERIREDEY